jgi:excisionase family DNA binding protein
VRVRVKVNMKKKYLSTGEAGQLLGISRIAVYKKIQSGKLKAEKIGRNYAIDLDDLGRSGDIVIHRSHKEKEGQINEAMDKVLREYSPALKKLGNE